MSNIDKIMYLIAWDRSDAEQREGISMAGQVTCLKAFFQPIGPGYGKNVWDNCAIIICERSDEELMPYMLDMLLWLEDLNWPGAEAIQERLKRFRNVRVLSELLNDMVPALMLIGKKSWLIFISELLENVELINYLDSNVVQILLNHRTGDSPVS